MKYLLLLLLACPVFADITGDVSIGKAEDNYRAGVKLGYDFDIGKIKVIPYIDYVNYFMSDSLLHNHPYRDVFGSGVRINIEQIYIDIRHECRHEVSSINSRETPYLYSEALPNASTTFITVGYKWGYDYD